MNKLYTRFTNILKGSKVKIIVIVGLIGMLMILLSEVTEDNRSDKTEKSENISCNSYETYAHDMENRLCGILNQIEGVGEAKVMITVNGTEEYIYAQEEKVKNSEKDYSTENEYVLIGSGSEKEALLKKVVNPEISGVIIICEGGDSNIVKERVYSSISAIFNISASQIYVTKLK